MKNRLRVSGLQQIEAALAGVNIQLQSAQISPLERLVLNGRRRELIAARWLVQRLLNPKSAPLSDARITDRTQTNLAPLSRSITAGLPGAITAKQLQSEIFDRLAAKLQLGLENLTPTPLEIDLLRLEKKRELFYIILRQIEGLLDELRFSQVTIAQLANQHLDLWQDLWASVTMEFFGRYHTLLVDNRSTELVPTLLADRQIVRAEILAKIPQSIELLNHLIFQLPLTIDNDYYPVDNEKAIERTCQLLENLTIELANAVIQPLLNRFGNVELIKSNFYDRRLLSSRDIERFRNDLSWRYRIDRYFIQPQAMFESQYRLFIITEYGIDRLTIYAPRREELANLTGIPLAVTLALETRDAIAPRLKSATTFLGTIIVYLLTEIIGRSIGLIGRGIIKGIGNIWQETNRKE